jgi:hypothetical protein
MKEINSVHGLNKHFETRSVIISITLHAVVQQVHQRLSSEMCSEGLKHPLPNKNMALKK